MKGASGGQKKRVKPKEKESGFDCGICTKRHRLGIAAAVLLLKRGSVAYKRAASNSGG